MPDIVHTITPTATRSTMSSLNDHVEQNRSGKEEALDAILSAIAAQAAELQDYADSPRAAEGLKDLAEALAWLHRPAQSH
ncbi:hypothetical protein ACFV1U_16905 [Streptomyces microflavus]|uniref:hypothetical protein n=1 Tax=Streptomyces microflavus TaxID=1919 RepID=UPI00368C5D7D